MYVINKTPSCIQNNFQDFSPRNDLFTRVRFKLRFCHQLMYSAVPNKRNNNRVGLEVFSDINERVGLNKGM